MRQFRFMAVGALVVLRRRQRVVRPPLSSTSTGMSVFRIRQYSSPPVNNSECFLLLLNHLRFNDRDRDGVVDIFCGTAARQVVDRFGNSL